ncbi:MAG: DUF362 domain-containing protein [Planctomycetota bacterium]|jgi:uncharacterized protein (DUF362 family)
MSEPIANDKAPADVSRREFLARTAKAAVAVAAAGSVGAWLVKRSALPVGGEEELVSLGDYAVPQTAGRMSITTGLDRAVMVQRGLEAVGGLDTYVKKGERVLLKVNAAFASPPLLGATTNPELVAEVARLCLRAGAKEVIVTDNPINDPVSCFALTGIGAAAEGAGAKVVLPKDSFFRPTSVEGGRLIRDWPLLYDPLKNVDKVIGITPLKDHFRSGASMTMKNWYGLLGGRRNKFHQDIHNTIKELAMMVRPTLVVLDGTQAMMTNGPTGGSPADLKDTRTMIVSTDQVAADAFGATLLGRSLEELPYITKAAEAGVGTADFESLKPTRVSAD